MGRKRVGLALSGAVGRGTAHIGVLRVLAREQIPIDVVAGSSAGALVGALYCAGVSPDQMQEWIGTLRWRDIASLVFPRTGLISFRKLERFLVFKIGDLSFADLRKPFAAVATDLVLGTPLTLCEGKVARAVHASCAVPGIVEPVLFRGRVLCDGGVSCNLPVAAARELGAEYVIAVDLFPHQIRKGWGPLGYAIAAIENLVRNSGGGLQAADCLITPEVAGAHYHTFGHFRQMIEKGERATELQLPAIRAALGIEG